jgi:Family of unknown function (DUF6328)
VPALERHAAAGGANVQRPPYGTGATGLAGAAAPGYGAGMDERQLRKKRDKELIELLNELRVALPGLQVLFAFLLVVPFSSRFDVDRTEKVAYLIALLATVLGSILLIAPSSYHRLRWREKNKERMLRTSNQLAIGGLVSIAVAMTASVFLVTDVLLPRAWAGVVTVGAGILFALAWFALPLSQPYDRWDDEDPAQFEELD